MLRVKLLVYCLLFCFLSYAQEYEYNYSFFSNSSMAGSHYFSRTANSGSSGIKNSNGKLPVSETILHTPGNALQLQYRNAADGKWQAAIYHAEIRGMDHFKKASFLSFWIFIASANTSLQDLPAVQLMRQDSSLTSAYTITAGKANEWQRVIIPTTSIKGFKPDEPWTIIAIVFAGQKSTDNREHTIYIDDIAFLSTDHAGPVSELPVIATTTGYAMHIDITWAKITDKNIRWVKIYRSADGKDYRAVGVQQPYINRYADYTGETGKKYFYKISFVDGNYEETNLSLPVAAATRSMTDDDLLTMVQEASFRYYWEAAESNSGLARENISGRQNMIAAGASGFGIMALIAGTERKFITRQESVARFVNIVNFLDKAETFHGMYPHFIDGLTGKVETFFGNKDNGADIVETSFLLQGLLAARQYFSGNDPQEKLIREKITTIWKKAEWSWFRITPDSKFLYWHWSPDQGWVIHHNLIGWNETMITYLLAIASPTHSVPARLYYSGWANQDSTGQKYRAAWGQTKEGSMYTNGNTYFGIKLDVGVSDGGPLFFTHYSYMGYDPHFITDRYTNYFINNQHIAKINHSYCVQNPNKFKGYGDSAWGLTASDGPDTYYADEPVVWQDHGKITPTGAISSFPYTPAESMKALKNYYFNYGKWLWGEYGFKDAFDLTNNWCSEIYMGLNQAPMAVMIENYRTGLIWKLFMQIPDIRNGLKKLEKEK
ncbi:MAG: glucoamylase family protein [Bacteroidota bacterium]|nr:glucoamylase family protein [Bacteroidota bacterium]